MHFRTASSPCRAALALALSTSTPTAASPTPASASPAGAGATSSSASPAGAAGPRSTSARLAVLTPRIEPAQPGLAEQLQAALSAPLRDRAIDLLAADAVARVAAGTCEEVICLRRLATELGATQVLRTTVTRGGRDYGLRIELLAARDGAVLAAIDESCELCGLGELREQVADQASRLAGKIVSITAPPPELALTSRPAGAEVRIDGRPAGLTPLRRPLLAGSHRVEVELAGHEPERREVTLAAGEHLRVDLALRRSRAQLRLRTGGWALLTAGLTLVAGGVALAILDGRCRGAGLDVAGNCHYVFDTDLGGAAFVAGGAALGAAGVVLLVRTRDRAKTPRLRARLGAGLALSF